MQSVQILFSRHLLYKNWQYLYESPHLSLRYKLL
nr:MAG TPA: hypothetical protein [Caudoviricetes sp.]